jgi:hypothetical protein
MNWLLSSFGIFLVWLLVFVLLVFVFLVFVFLVLRLWLRWLWWLWWLRLLVAPSNGATSRLFAAIVFATRKVKLLVNVLAMDARSSSAALAVSANSSLSLPLTPHR